MPPSASNNIKTVGHLQNERMGRIQMQATISSLVEDNHPRLESLAALSPDLSEITRLRFSLAFPDLPDARKALRQAVAWRSGPGRMIVESAAEAFEKATAGGGWDNDVARSMAPHAAKINKFISSENILTLGLEGGDLLYVIRASAIDDKALMNSVSVEEMGEFFAYVKEIHSLVANANSKKTGRLCNVIFANDVSGVRKPPDKRFSQALTKSSNQYEKLYPSLAGTTMILNLPLILQAFVGLFKPLFPKAVQDKLKFVRAPILAGLKKLTPLVTSSSTRKSFIKEIQNLLR